MEFIRRTVAGNATADSRPAVCAFNPAIECLRWSASSVPLQTHSERSLLPSQNFICLDFRFTIIVSFSIDAVSLNFLLESFYQQVSTRKFLLENQRTRNIAVHRQRGVLGIRTSDRPLRIDSLSNVLIRALPTVNNSPHLRRVFARVRRAVIYRGKLITR